jgi:hypothetical protein
MPGRARVRRTALDYDSSASLPERWRPAGDICPSVELAWHSTEAWPWTSNLAGPPEPEFFTVLGGNPIMSFICASSKFTLIGIASGELAGGLNAMSSSSDSSFGHSVGEQALSMIEGSGAGVEATLTASSATVASQATEIKRRP